MPRLSKIGAACLAAFGFTTGGVQNITASALIAGGGGGGGNANTSGSGVRMGGGGGAGGLLTTSTLSLNPTLSYTVVVGAGGSGGATMTNGSNSVFNSTITANGGGYGGNALNYGQNGGSGGGGGNNGFQSPAGTSNQGTFSGWTAYGNSGGTGTENAASSAGGGGGGAGAAGANSSSLTGGNGGVGIASSISGTSTYYAGGGGGGTEGGTNGTGGNGGGGAGASGNGNPGTANTGGGGGGGGHTSGSDGNSYLGGNGGSGVIIISYAGAQQFGGGIVTSVGGNTIHTFTTSGTLSPLNSLTASYLIVAGGGGGGYRTGGGGGAGGLLTGSTLSIDTSSTYIVTVGAGGNGGVSGASNGSAGVNSSISIYSTAAVGGGGGGSYGNPAGANGVTGGSGGGGSQAGSGAVGTSGQGSSGGNGISGSPYSGGGGGGAGAVGSNASGNNAGSGGVGLASSISGTSTYYAGGGGGGTVGSLSGVAGSGGLGGGAAGTNSSSTPANATANTGGGGGGGGADPGANGSNGGSGIVILSYPGSTQQMAGGTVTIVGGNVIHTFTTSGYLTPLTYFNNSLRFRSGASAYLNRTPTVASNRTTWTWSGWVKRGSYTGADQVLFSAYDNSSASDATWTAIKFNNADNLILDGWTVSWRISNSVYRDYAAWYHIVVAVDTTQATASNRVKIYVNGVQLTSFSTSNDPSLNQQLGINSAEQHRIASINYSSGYRYFDGEITGVNFIDGQALAPTAFGTFNSYGVWQPVTYGGSYGTNGFFLPFTNTASTTTLGYDFSPAGNNWTTNNISLTAGSTYDSMTDVPTLTSATAANYAVLNPLNTYASTIVDGNLKVTFTDASVSRTTFCTMGVTSGKWYWETTIVNGLGASYYPGIGVNTNLAYPPTSQSGSDANGYMYLTTGQKFNNGSLTSYGATYATNDVIGVALDMGAGTITFYKNNVSQGQAFSGITGTAVPCFIGETSAACSVNFGQQPFQYTPPSGFVALNTYNM
jgi:hypothetical protein